MLPNHVYSLPTVYWPAEIQKPDPTEYAEVSVISFIPIPEPDS